jgi:hypothetical protein
MGGYMVKFIIGTVFGVAGFVMIVGLAILFTILAMPYFYFIVGFLQGFAYRI